MKLKSFTLENIVKNMFDEQLCEFTDKALDNTFKKDPYFVFEYILKRIDYHHLIIA